ncbi:MAG TPA: RNA repair transcriptional activator RtcR family protein, partial [Tahibacter sp.]|nr:RNA repair transcriptional activator RtcR family protein [Tahibacter sp.]
MQSKPLVVIGFVGTVLDAADGPGRWEKWRPSVALGMYDDLLVSRLELLLDERKFSRLAGRLRADLAEVSPETQVRVHDFFLSDPWDFEQVFAALHEFARNYPFDTEREDYLVHISTGTHVAQICWFLLTEARFFPARLLQTSPPPRQRTGEAGKYAIIDLDLARYDRIAQRFARESEDTASFLKSGIATRSATFNRMIEQIERVAIRSKAPMLLLGPTGAGKSMLARNLFELKQRRHALKGRFVEVNCATLRGDGAGSALFG